jgi:hypothetical protein
MLLRTAATRINYVAATMAKTRTKGDIYVERVPIPLDQRTIAALAWLERTTGEPAAQIAGRFLADLCAQFGKVKGATLQ